jgi:ubiquinone/menaquinone biosynthesis C-methylase UbiE
MRVAGYLSRWDFILDHCVGRRVLHLGCVGETDVSPEVKIEAFRSKRVLHPRLMEVAREVVGVDLDAATIKLIRSKLDTGNLVIGDVEHLENCAIDGTFDVIVCGDLVEHLTSPGLMLEGMKRFMTPESSVIMSTPNQFSLLANIRFSLGSYREGAEHVTVFSKLTLTHLLERHGYQLRELYTCYDRPPQTGMARVKFKVGVPFYRLLPERGGTLLVTAQATL